MAGNFVESIKDVASEFVSIRRKHAMHNIDLILSAIGILALVFNILLSLKVFDLSAVMSGSIGIAVVFLGVAGFFNVDGCYPSHIISGITLTVSGVLLALKEFYVINGDWVTLVYVSILIVGIVISSIVSLALSRR